MQAFAALVAETRCLLTEPGWKEILALAGGPYPYLASRMVMIHEVVLRVLSDINLEMGVSDFHIDPGSGLDEYEMDDCIMLEQEASMLATWAESAADNEWFSGPVWLEYASPSAPELDAHFASLRARIPGWLEVADAEACRARIEGKCKAGDEALKGKIPEELLARFQAIMRAGAARQGRALVLVRNYLAAALQFLDARAALGESSDDPQLRRAARALIGHFKVMITDPIWAEFDEEWSIE
jgi:hypothetical protein